MKNSRLTLTLSIIGGFVLALYTSLLYTYPTIDPANAAYVSAVTNRTNKTTGTGCAGSGCHPSVTGTGCAGSSDCSMSVSFSGSTALYPGETGTYVISASKNNITSYIPQYMGIEIAGSDNTLGLVGGEPTQIISNEIVHTNAKGTNPSSTTCSTTAPCSASLSYQFTYQMPSSAAAGSQHTLYGVSVLGPFHPGPYKHVSFSVSTRVPAAPTSVSLGTITHNSIAINWSGSAPAFYARYKAGTTPPSSPTDGLLLYDGTGTSATATGLNPSTTYSFAVWGKVTFGSTTTYSSTPVSISATTLAPPPGQQFAATAGWGTRQNPTSQGKVLFVDANGAVALYNGTTTGVVEPQGVQSAVDTIVFNLGSGSSPGQVVAAWRRGTDSGHVYVEGGTVRLVTATNPINAAQAMNAEGVSVADGCVFMILQAFDAGANTVKHVFKIDPATGAGGTSISGTADLPNGGVFRVSSSQCKATWALWDSATTNKLQYYNGTTVATIDTNVMTTPSDPQINQGKIVYAKLVNGVSQVFLYDTTAASPASVQLTSYTDATKVVAEPRTDGRHVSWILKNADGTNPNIVLYGGMQLTSNDMLAINSDFAYQLNRGEMMWKDSATNLHYLSPSGFASFAFPAGSVYDKPWLADGFVAYLASNVGFRIVGTTPNDVPPPPPMAVTATYGNGEVTLNWDNVLGATSYNIYYAEQSGVTKINYTSLTGGTRITGATTPRTITGLTNDHVYYFVVTTVDATGEGGNSMEVSARPFPLWLPSNVPGVGFIGLGTDRSNPNLALAGGGKGSTASNTDIYRTINGGHTWSAVGGGASGKDAKAFAIDGTKAYAATTNGGILGSTDSGATWTTALNANGYGEQIASIALDPTNTNTIYAGDYVTPPNSGEPLVVKSTNGGSTWSALPSASIHAYVIQTDPVNAGTVYAAGTGTPNIGKSTDGGATWNNVAPRFGAIYSMALDPNQPSTLYASITDQAVFPYANLGIYKSIDGGTTWVQKNNGLPAAIPRINYLLADPVVANQVHAATDAGYFISRDGGDNWTAENSGLPSSPSVTSLAMMPSRKLLATAGTGIYILNLSAGLSLTTVSPLSASTNGGTSLTIGGKNFISGATVTIGGLAATNVAVSGAGTITATAPAHAAGLVDIVVTNPGGASSTLPAAITYVASPVVSSVYPSSGPTTGGTSLVINGVGFQSGATVTVGGVAATAVSVAGTSTITATTPAHAAGAVDVTVTNPDTLTGTLAGGFAYVVPSPPPTPGAFAVQQIAAAGGWGNRAPSTSGGQILFNRNDDVVLYNGTTTSTVQPADATNRIEPTVWMLGSGSTAGHVIGGWRRGAGFGNVSVDGNTPVMTVQNPESVAIADGCVFMVLQGDPNKGQPSFQHAYKVDPATGSVTLLSTGTVTQGAGRIQSSGCKAIWTWQPTGTSPVDVQYWNGSAMSTLDTAIKTLPRMTNGRVVYSKLVSGVQQVFVVDTNGASPTPVQVSAETDPTKMLQAQTDGRHVVWYRSNADGTSPQLVLNGGLVFPTGTLGFVDSLLELPFELNRGQLLWKNASGSFFYDDGKASYQLDPSPAPTMETPFLRDGYIAFFSTGNGVYRMTVTPPDDAVQPSPPLLVTAAPASGNVTVQWDRVLGATAYNLYLAEEPGVTKSNYASLAGGRRIPNVTSPFTVTGLAANKSYFFAVTTVEGATEGASSRVASTTLFGTLSWQSVGGLAGNFFSVAADRANSSLVYAGTNGPVYKSADGGITWTQSLASSGGTRISALAVDGPRVFAETMPEADILRSIDSGATWTKILDAIGFGEQNGSLVIDPVSSSTMYGGDFKLSSYNFVVDSLVIKSTDGGATWAATPHGPSGADDPHAYTLAIDPNNPAVLYAGGSGTPNVAKSINRGASWIDEPIAGGGQIYSLAVDPRNSNVVYATTRDYGVFKSLDGGKSWTQKSQGLTGLAGGGFVTGAGFNSIIIDPQNSNTLHLGAGNGYWYSIDAGENWTAANTGFGTTPYIYALTLTPARRLIAATSSGLYMLSIGPAPVVVSISPNTGNVAGGATVTISGSGFQPAATVTFGGAAATNVTVVNATTITATTPAHAAGAVDVVVTNFDTRSGTLTGGFTYSSVPPPIVSSINPSSGSTNGGTAVTISGSNFSAGATVTFGGAATTNIVIVNSSTINATTPAHTAGTVSVIVRNSDGQAGTSSFTYIVPPTISNVTPNSGPEGGGTSITIAGTGFMSGATVSFGGTAATNIVVVSATTITAKTPVHAPGPVNVVVTNTDGQSATSTSAFTYVAGPHITSVSPNSGTPSGGTNVTITGTSFMSGATVSFGGTAATNVTFVSSTTITATTPAHTAGSADVVVLNPDGQSGTLAAGFTFSTSPPGDSNGDGSVTVVDVFYTINYLFVNGAAPIGPGDANGDGQVTVADIFYLINYLFTGGPAPH